MAEQCASLPQCAPAAASVPRLKVTNTMADRPEDEEEGIDPSSVSPSTPQRDSTEPISSGTPGDTQPDDLLARLFATGDWHAREETPAAETQGARRTEPVAPVQPNIVEDMGAPTAPASASGPTSTLSAGTGEQQAHQPAGQPQEEPVRYVPPPTPRLSPGQGQRVQPIESPPVAGQATAQQAYSPQTQGPQAQPTQPFIPFVAPTAPSQAAPSQAAPSQTSASQAAIEPQNTAQRQVVSLAPESLRTSTTTSLPVVVPFGAATPLATPGADPGQMVRCRACGKSAPAQLALCPHCGRELRAAPSRWLTIGLPAAIALLLIALVAVQAMRGASGWMGAPAESAGGWLAQLSASLDPQINVIPNNESAEAAALPADFVAPTVPVEGVEESAETTSGAFEGVSDASLVGDDSAATSIAPSELQATAEVAATAAVSGAEPNNDAAEGVAAGVAEVETAATATLAPTVAALVLPTQTVVPTETPIPTETPTPLPTDTPAPTNTPLPPSYTVQQGDTALAIAGKLGVTLADLLAYNGMTEREAALLSVGQVLRVPGGVVTADTAAGERTYVVRDGDTLVQIARVNNSTVAAIMTANNMTQADVFALRPGQTLVIPAPTPEPAVATAAALATASAAATASAPTPTTAPVLAPTLAPTVAQVVATVAPATGGMRVTAPILRAPVSGVSIDCSRPATLQWLRSADISPDDFYRVHLGFVSGRDDGGNPRITWIVEQSVASTVTQLPLDATLCNTAPADYGNQWRWYVDVVADSGGNKLPVSTPSDIWGFAWN